MLSRIPQALHEHVQTNTPALVWDMSYMYVNVYLLARLFAVGCDEEFGQTPHQSSDTALESEVSATIAIRCEHVKCVCVCVCVCVRE